MGREMFNSDPAFYFKRVWTNGGTDDDEIDVHRVLADGTFEIRVGVKRRDLPPELRDLEAMSMVPPGLVIYGRRVQAIPEDRSIVAEWERNGSVYAECYSTLCVEGEVGTHPRSEVEEISAEEFEAAKARGWA